MLHLLIYNNNQANCVNRENFLLLIEIRVLKLRFVAPSLPIDKAPLHPPLIPATIEADFF
ncbi:MAG: hypothetical protein A3F68_06140 [Acidobacteria bacterium RIFCSPLOWO2_12_FULL_54_10]|nr:MAG: hypothetical protein A3F68_06140 [Acidobacteria bacterium RIFCSPLOWO2_12_FULL_54_10]